MLAYYAFEELNLHRLGAAIPAYNHAALHLFKKLGFRQEACRREALALDGQRWDFNLFGLLRDEWQADAALQARKHNQEHVDLQAQDEV